MAAPTITARILPTGYKMPEGFRCTFAFSLSPGINLWEVEVTPFGDDVGDLIDTTTQHNIEYETGAFPALKKTTPAAYSCFFDPDSLPTIRGMVGKNQSVTCWFPNGGAEARWGGIKSFKVKSMKPGQAAMADVEIVATNYDHTNKVEAGPAYQAAAGT